MDVKYGMPVKGVTKNKKPLNHGKGPQSMCMKLKITNSYKG